MTNDTDPYGDIKLTGKWIRTCQECGNKQTASPPRLDRELTNAYRNAVCRKCRSPSLDYGSPETEDTL